MAKLPRESVNSDIVLSPAVQEIAELMRREFDYRELTTKELMILTSIDEMTLSGPVDFNSSKVCDRLNVKHPMVNHYFGSRDQLIAEVTVWAYRAWSYQIVTALKSAPANSEKRLRAFIDAELNWAQKMKAVGVLIQYPLLSGRVRELVETEYTSEMQKYFEYHLALLTTVIADMRRGKASQIEFDMNSYPRKQLLAKHPREFLDAASIAWSIHGLAMWSSESHSATRNFATEVFKNLSAKAAIKNHINNMISVAQGSRVSQ